MPRTLVGIGCTSGLGLEALQLLLASTRTPYQLVLGARSSASGDAAVRQLQAAAKQPTNISWLPLELADFPRGVTAFADQLKQQLASANDSSGIDCLLLNAAVFKSELHQMAAGWTEEAIVNHFSQHLLMELLSPLLTDPTAEALPRVVYVSSALQDRIKTKDDLEVILNGDKQSTGIERYSASKLAQMIGAFEHKRRLKGKADVVAVSPGFVPTSGLNRDSPFFQRIFLRYILSWAPFATSMHDGATSILRAISSPPDTLDFIMQSRSTDDPLYLGVKGDKRTANPLISERGTDLWHEWTPSVGEMENWKQSVESK